MNLIDVLDDVESSNIVNLIPKNTEIKGIVCDSRKVESGFIFVAHRGKILNGEDFIDSAIQKGAVAVVLKNRDSEELKSDKRVKSDAGRELETLKNENINGNSVRLEDGICRIYVEDTRKAIALMSANFYGHPSEKMKMIGVTASNGKTSTTFMLDEIHKAAGIPAGVIGTVYARTGKSQEASVLTTPDSADLQRYLSEMVESGYKACIMEVSSISVEMKRVYGVDYDIFAFNNISREHIDDHGDFETYYSVKASIPKHLNGDSILVLNSDQPLVYKIKDETKADVLAFSANYVPSIEGDSGVAAYNDAFLSCYIRKLDLSTGRGNFTMVLGQEGQRSEVAVSLGVAGYHNVVNALSAATVAYAAGIDKRYIKQGLEAYKGVERRFQCVYERDFTIYDDHFANSGNIDVTFETLHKKVFNDFVLCYAVRGSRGVTVNSENAYAMIPHLRKLGVTKIIATASEETVGAKDVLTADEKNVFLNIMKEEGIEVEWHEKLGTAVVSALDSVSDGDVLLLAGCQGMDSGAHIALDYLYKKNGDSSVLEPLKNRVCGFLPS